MKYLIIAMAAMSAFTQADAQRKLPFPLPAGTSQTDTTTRDTAKAVLPVPRSAIRNYKDVITRHFVSKKGLFSVHQWKDQLYFEIPDSLLGRDIMVINRLSQGPAGYGTYAGEELDEKTIRFETTPDSNIVIRYVLVVSEGEEGSALSKAVQRSAVDPVAVTLPIKAYGEGRKSYVVDVSKLIADPKSFVNSISASTGIGKHSRLTSMKDFYVTHIQAYPMNVELGISKNMESTQTGALAGMPVTVETRASFIALPKVPMQRRFFDPRVGFFADIYNAFSDDQQKAEQRKFILRWRLEPRAEDREKWLKGELVEPAKPIVIYIDPATPAQWRPYLIQGVNDWQKAFEKAGFKNAIMGKEWPENDSTMDMEDARYSMLVYLPSEVANAYGPQVHDPRSGEIIQTHIGWYHNVMELLHTWYMIQASAVDPAARKAKFDTELMGNLIRFVSSHEVGHTLGLRHNFGSSSQTPVDSLRSKTYLHKNGHTASIMDYARFNYVAQPEDGIPEEDLFPRIGDYDKWAIEWGYKNSGAANANEDKKIVTAWIEKNVTAKKRTWFGDGETKKTDPRCQTEDLGDDVMKANTYGIKNLRRILPHLPEWTHEDGGINENLGDLYSGLKDQYTRYVSHVLRYIGGVYQTVQSETSKEDVYTQVPGATIKEAVAFINDQVFTTPYWLLDKQVMNKVTMPAAVDFVGDVQSRTINSLLDFTRITSLAANARQMGDNGYSVEAYIADIHRDVWKELKQDNIVMDSYRRDLQKTYLGAMLDIFTSKDPAVSESDSYSLISADLHQLKGEIEAASHKQADKMTRYHLQDLYTRIKNALEPKI